MGLTLGRVSDRVLRSKIDIKNNVPICVKHQQVKSPSIFTVFFNQTLSFETELCESASQRARRCRCWCQYRICFRIYFSIKARDYYVSPKTCSCGQGLITRQIRGCDCVHCRRLPFCFQSNLFSVCVCVNTASKTQAGVLVRVCLHRSGKNELFR